MPNFNRFTCLGAVLLAGFALLFQAAAAGAATAPPPFAANSGGTGLFDMPSARLMADWSLRPHYSWADPYAIYAVTATVLPWIEINGRLVRISGIGGGPGRFSEYGDYKDKVIDVKFRLLEESDFWPALALGANDIHGTGLFSSRYLVAGKLWGPFDLTLGLGQGLLAGEQMGGAGSSGSASQDSAWDFLKSGLDRKTRPFAGVELRLNEHFSLLIEYSSLAYEKLKGVDEGAASPINFGLKYRLGDHLQLSTSWQRGYVFGWSLSSYFPLEPVGLLPHKKQPFRIADQTLREKAGGVDKDELARIIRREVFREKLSNVRVAVADSSVWVEFENPTYQSNIAAMGRATAVVASLVPPRIQWLYINLKANDLVRLTLKLNREAYEAYARGLIDDETLFRYLETSNQGNESRHDFNEKHPESTRLTESYYGSRRFTYGLKPSWRTLLNDPSGFVKHNIALAWKAAYYPWSGGQFRGMIRTPLYNNISSANEVEEQEAVRTDFIEYEKQQDIRLEVLGFAQVVDLPGHWLAKAEGGFFESAYGGAGLELYRPAAGGRWGFGLEGQWVKKRDVDNSFTFRSGPSYHTAFLNLHYRLLPDYGVDVGLKLGRFLAGDQGVRLDLSRTYKYYTIGAWYTITDTDRFTASYNQGYHDKGVYLSIPFSIFTDHESPIQLLYSLSPWTRDPGQTVSQIYSLYPMARMGDPDYLRRHFDEFMEN
jgi:hypothetical protein